eukprot:3858156-Amphidinium_carterae.1
MAQQLYSAALPFTVQHGQTLQVKAAADAAAHTSCVLRGGDRFIAFPDETWWEVQEPVQGWLSIPGSHISSSVQHDLLRAKVVFAFSEAALVRWTQIAEAKYLDYAIHWITKGGDETTPNVAKEHILWKRSEFLIHDLPPDTELCFRVVACIYTGTKAMGGRLLAILPGEWVDFETEPPITRLDEEHLCLDPMAQFRGKCKECSCLAFVAGAYGEARPTDGLDSVLCRRCGCPCTVHVILGEFSHRRVQGATASALRPPTRLVQAAAKEVEEEKQVSQPRADQPAAIAARRWSPEDCPVGQDKTRFVLDKVDAAHTLYETLGLSPGVDDVSIRQAHRRISLYVHPDKVQARADAELTKQAETAFKIVSAAYELLGNPSRRSVYDRNLRLMPRPQGSAQTVKGGGVSATKLLQRFLNKATRGWDLTAKPPGDWEKFGDGVYGRAERARIEVIHVITQEVLVLQVQRTTTVLAFKRMLIDQIRRGRVASLELAALDGEELRDHMQLSVSQEVVVAGIPSIGPPVEVK